MSYTILVVDDERAIVDILDFNLKKEGFSTIHAYDGETGLKYALERNPDLVLLDVMLPKMDGFTVCKKIREKQQTPIVMITARDEEVDKVLGLELGADDYVTKPFSMRELMARVKANLRRTTAEAQENNGEVLNFGSIKVDSTKYTASTPRGETELTCREFELLRHLATMPNRIVTREDLMENVWGYEYFGDVRTVDVTVRRLREKIELDPSNPQYIITKRGVGYYFKKG